MHCNQKAVLPKCWLHKGKVRDCEEITLLLIKHYARRWEQPCASDRVWLSPLNFICLQVGGG